MSEEQTASVEASEKVTQTNPSKGEKHIELPIYFGQKAGMSRIFDEQGNLVPVTVIKLIPNHVTQVKQTAQKQPNHQGYQIGFWDKKENKVNKPIKGMMKKAGVNCFHTRFSDFKTAEASSENLGAKLTASAFQPGSIVNVTGVSKGKGFQGVIKRHHFAGGPGAHGSTFHRTTGSIGMRSKPGKVLRGKRMPGHMGQDTRTVLNLTVVEVNPDQGYMLIKGAVPGAKNEIVKIVKSNRNA